MASIRFSSEPGGVIVPGARFREYAQASYTEQAVGSLLQNVLALGSEKFDAFLQQRSLRGRVNLDPVILLHVAGTKSRNALPAEDKQDSADSLRMAKKPNGVHWRLKVYTSFTKTRAC